MGPFYGESHIGKCFAIGEYGRWVKNLLSLLEPSKSVIVCIQYVLTLHQLAWLVHPQIRAESDRELGECGWGSKAAGVVVFPNGRALLVVASKES